MPDQETIDKHGTLSTRDFEIKVDGSPLPEEVQIFGFEVFRDANAISRASLYVRDGDHALRDFPLSNEDLFKPGAEVTIDIGWDFQKEQIFKGVVALHKVEFSRGSEPFLQVDLRDLAWQMALTRKCKYFYEKTDSDIIEEIAGEYSLEGKDIESTSLAHKEMVQYHVTDWDFILFRAEANGLLVFTDENKLIVKAPKVEGSGKYTITHGATMLDFHAELDTRFQYPAVKSFAWDYSAQEVKEKEGSADLTEAGNLGSSDLSANTGIEAMNLMHPGFKSDEELEAWANGILMRSKLSRLKGYVRVHGIPDIKPGDTIELTGVGDRFNGLVYVTGVTQSFDVNEWVTEIRFGLDETPFHHLYTNVTDTGAAGLVPPIRGLHAAKVKNIHEDPDGEYRVQVYIPVISASDDGIWARVATLDAGADRGTFFRPELDDEVLVGFINDDPRDPVILGMMHSSSLASPLEPEEKNPLKGIVTRSGIKLLFEDENVEFSLETPAGNKFFITEKDKKITLEDQNGNKMEMSKDGIKLESAKDIILKATGDVKVEGVNIESKAQAALKGEGTASAELKSSGTTTVKGSMVQIN